MPFGLGNSSRANRFSKKKTYTVREPHVSPHKEEKGLMRSIKSTGSLGGLAAWSWWWWQEEHNASRYPEEGRLQAYLLPGPGGWYGPLRDGSCYPHAYGSRIERAVCGDGGKTSETFLDRVALLALGSKSVCIVVYSIIQLGPRESVLINEAS